MVIVNRSKTHLILQDAPICQVGWFFGLIDGLDDKYKDENEEANHQQS